MRVVAVVLAVSLAVASCGGDEPAAPLPDAGRALTLTSSAFADGGTIPRRFTCDGEDVSPPLAWSGVPRKAGELALVVEDPDAGGFVHWTVAGIEPARTGMPEGSVPPRAVEPDNDFGEPGWGGPCPPEGDGPHRYVFALYATRAPLGLGADASAADVRAALAREAIARGELTGRFGR